MFELEGSDGKSIHARCWRPSGHLKAAVQIAHGMGEHIGRYDRVAESLNEAGYVVYGNDHRGQGTTDPDRLGELGDDGWNLTRAGEIGEAQIPAFQDRAVIVAAAGRHAALLNP